jgi:cholesterol transport system auxiliary component
MSHRRMTVLFGSILAFSAIGAGGCAETSYRKEYYIVEVTRNAPPVAVRSDETLEVRRFTVNTAFATRSLVYRLNEYQYEPDYYRQYLIAPAAMITEETRHWLANSGLFKQILPPGSQIASSYSLQAIVTALYGDFTDKAAPAAVLRIRFFVAQRKGGDEVIIFSRAYRTATPMSDKTGPALVDAMSKNLVEILTRLETDLQTALTGKAGEAG